MTRLMHALALGAVLVAATAEPAASQTVELDTATIADLNAAFDTGALTAEQLTKLYLSRIQAYDRRGPTLHAVITLNPKALETARALDAERKAKGRRSPLHGIPVVLKDNYDTADMPTTGASVLLEGSTPPEDAFVVKRLREAGAVILAKVNLSEFASGGTRSSLGGQSLNPHDLARSPSGSSGGTGVAVAAGYAQFGLGTDTGGSIRGPSTANGIVGLKPTHGLMSRDGIIPLALSFDTGGPMARHVYDVAAALGAMAGVDPADEATRKGEGRALADYTTALDAGALRGARIGVARDFMGADEEVDWVVESALDAIRRAGATVVDVRYPSWLLDVKERWYRVVRWREFPVQVAAYLAGLGPAYPKTLDELIARARLVNAPRPDGAGPNPSRWSLFSREAKSGALEDAEYRAVRDHALAAMRVLVEGLFAAEKLDVIVYPTSPTRPDLIAARSGDGGRDVPSAVTIANMTGLPDLVVPAGFTSDRLPVGLSLFGPAVSEARLLALGYAFEQSTKARRRPIHAPALPGETIRIR